MTALSSLWVMLQLLSQGYILLEVAPGHRLSKMVMTGPVFLLPRPSRVVHRSSLSGPGSLLGLQHHETTSPLHPTLPLSIHHLTQS